MTELAYKRAIRDIATAHGKQAGPDFARHELKTWVKAAGRLVEMGQLEVGAFAVRRMSEEWPALPWARQTHRLLEMMPAADPDAPPFVDDLSASIQVARRPGVETVLVVFCGGGGRFGLPLAMLHRWLSRWPVSVIYLRDNKDLGYLSGIEPLGEDLAKTLDGLRAKIAGLGAKRIVCYGPSFGGYGALRYGLELGAQSVLQLSGMVNMEPGFNAGLNYAATALRMRAALPAAVLDLRKLYLASERPPRVLAVYAEHNWDDRIHAEHLIGLDGVAPVQMDGAKTHNTTAELMRRGRYDDLVRQALDPGQGLH